MMLYMIGGPLDGKLVAIPDEQREHMLGRPVLPIQQASVDWDKDGEETVVVSSKNYLIFKTVALYAGEVGEELIKNWNVLEVPEDPTAKDRDSLERKARQLLLSAGMFADTIVHEYVRDDLGILNLRSYGYTTKSLVEEKNDDV